MAPIVTLSYFYVSTFFSPSCQAHICSHTHVRAHAHHRLVGLIRSPRKSTSFGVSFAGNSLLLFVHLAFVVHIAVFWDPFPATPDDVMRNSFDTFRVLFLGKSLIANLASFVVSWAVTVRTRLRWRLDLFQRNHLASVRNMLYDLVPPTFVDQLIAGSERMECSVGRAVVLQLDICNFTTMSSVLTPLRLANLMNGLVKDFDDRVTGQNLTKIDTIGDAYIVVAFLTVAPDVEARENSALVREASKRCLSMLMLARGMLECVAKHREESGVDLHCRIGIAHGSCLSGILGRSQPRFCVFGEAIKRASALEQTGFKDALHCTEEFYNLVRQRPMSNLAAENSVAKRKSSLYSSTSMSNNASKRSFTDFFASLSSGRVKTDESVHAEGSKEVGAEEERAQTRIHTIHMQVCTEHNYSTIQVDMHICRGGCSITACLVVVHAPARDCAFVHQSNNRRCQY